VKVAESRGAPTPMRSRRVFVRRAAPVLGLFVALFGCASRELSPPPADPNPMDRETYHIGVNDRIQVSVWRNEDLSVTVPVRPDGKISVPLIDDVQAEGLTAMELKEVITRELAEYITAPDVTVIVSEMRSKGCSVIGAVANNTRIPLTGELRVLEAIALVGGFTTFADKSDIRIVRRGENGSETEFRFDYDAYIKGRAPGTNIVLQDGDTIIVPD